MSEAVERDRNDRGEEDEQVHGGDWYTRLRQVCLNEPDGDGGRDRRPAAPPGADRLGPSAAAGDDVTDPEKEEHRRELRQWYDVLFEGPYTLKYPALPTGPVRLPGRTHADMLRSNPSTRHLLADLESDLGVGGSLRGTYRAASRSRRERYGERGAGESAETSSPSGSDASVATSTAVSSSWTTSALNGIMRHRAPEHSSVSGDGMYRSAAATSAPQRAAPVPISAAVDAEPLSASSPASASTGNVHRWLEQPARTPSREPFRHRPHWVFVYGTLKRGWPNHPLLRHCLFEGAFVTCERYPLVIAGTHYTPFLLWCCQRGKHVRGEVYRVDDDELAMLDVLENVGENYRRERILVRHVHDHNFMVETFAYFKCHFDHSLLSLEHHEEYRDRRYVPRHLRTRSASVSGSPRRSETASPAPS